MTFDPEEWQQEAAIWPWLDSDCMADEISNDDLDHDLIDCDQD
jgi:hypothetical protein